MAEGGNVILYNVERLPSGFTAKDALELGLDDWTECYSGSMGRLISDLKTDARKVCKQRIHSTGKQNQGTNRCS